MKIRNCRAFTLPELIAVVVILGILAVIVIPPYTGRTSDEKLKKQVVANIVQNFEEQAGRDRPKDRDLLVYLSTSRGPEIYTVKFPSKNLLWIVNSETGHVSEANPETGEIIKSEDVIDPSTKTTDTEIPIDSSSEEGNPNNG